MGRLAAFPAAAFAAAEERRGPLLALVSAGLLVLANPPYDLWPLALVGLVPLYCVIRTATPGQAARLAWLTGLLGNVAGCPWAVTLLVRYFHVSPPVAVLVAAAVFAYQAVVFGLWGGLSRLLVERGRLSWLFVGPLMMAVLEGSVPFVFKWYLAITVWRAWPLLQVAEAGGPAAVSALVVLTNLVLAEALLARRERRPPSRATLWAMAVVVAVVAGGGLRAWFVARAEGVAPKIDVGLVQTNFGIVSVANRSQYGSRYQETLRQATSEAARRGARLVVWPETMWPYLFDRELPREFPPDHPWALRPGVKGQLLFGALTHEFGGTTVYNSALLLSESGVVAGRYDKVHLVPFGEYVPFARSFPEWARRVRERAPDAPSVTAGERPLLLEDGELHVAPVICSEDLDVGHVHAAARLGANLLVAITNDAWFGDSAAPRQHLALAVLRAVETRRNLVRSTNTGVSAIVDALGRVRLEGPLYDVPRDEPLPPTVLVGEAALLDAASAGPYVARFFPAACLAAVGAALLAGRLRKGRMRRKP